MLRQKLKSTEDHAVTPVKRKILLRNCIEASNSKPPTDDDRPSTTNTATTSSSTKSDNNGDSIVDLVVKKDSQQYLEIFNRGRELEAAVLGAEDDILEHLGKAPSDCLDVKSDVTDSNLIGGHRRNKLLPKNNRKAVWQDDDDLKVGSINVIKDSRYRKFAKVGEIKVENQEYQQRLKKRFEVVSGSQPSWADLDLKDADNKHSMSDDDEEKELSHKTGDFISKSSYLAPTYLDYKPVSHANKAQFHKSTVSTARFHPTSQVIMTAGKDNNLSFFQVDGVKNTKIQTLHLENYPIYNARFTTDGSTVILGGRHKAFYEYDMMSGHLMNIQPIKGLGNMAMSYFEMSPCGKYIAFRGDYGYISIISTKSKELVCQLKMNGSVRCLTFSSDGCYLYTFGDDAEVYVWQMDSRQCIHKFRDEGCLDGTSISVDNDNKFITCGSATGVVNIYKLSDCMSKADPKPVKTLNNLLTQCTTSRFNTSSQLLAIASLNTERSVKLVNTSSMSIYQNFPSLVDTMGCPTDIDFSPNSGYLSACTNKGIVHMYRLNHFTSY